MLQISNNEDVRILVIDDEKSMPQNHRMPETAEAPVWQQRDQNP